MDREELSDYVKDYVVYKTLKSFYWDLSLAPPNGANNHMSACCLQGVSSWIRMYEEDEDWIEYKTEPLKDLKIRDLTMYNFFIKLISDCVDVGAKL